MPDASHRATPALRTTAQDGKPVRAFRLAVGALLTLSLLVIPQVSSPEPVAAGSSCTGWTSKVVPPNTIRVLRTKTGRVETVKFRLYVARVMASGEWPSRLKMATLEAGALATKQYAWYYAMKGNHRPNYVRGGKCYDVRDDTNDQLYKHYAAPSDRQWAAINKTWALTLRKNGRFFLTGYRAGTKSTCAADANGWKLYAKSVEACARKGWSYIRILKAYMNPNLGFVWSDKLGPTLTLPKVKLSAGNTVGNGAATVSWKPMPNSTTVTRYRLQRKSGGGNWRDVELASTSARSNDSYIKPDAGNRFRVKAKDNKGNWGYWTYSSVERAAVEGPQGKTIAGNTVTASDTTNIKKRFKGSSVAVVAKTGPGMGSIKVLLNGNRVATIDLEKFKANKRKLVWARNFGKSKWRTITVKPVNKREPVVFQGFFILR